MNHKPRISMFHTDFIYITKHTHTQHNYHDDVMQQVMKYGNFIEASLHGSSAQLTESASYTQKN